MMQAISIIAAVLAAVVCGVAVLAGVLGGMLGLVRAWNVFVLMFDGHPNIVGGSLSVIAVFTYLVVHYSRRNTRGFEVMPLARGDDDVKCPD